MKVRYIGKQYIGTAFSEGKIYDVISVEKGWYRIMDDWGLFCLYSPEMFEPVEE